MSKNAWVSDVWNPVGDGIGWTPLFARAFNDWEIILLERLLQKIQAVRVQREEEDRVIWTASKDGVFSVRSLYSMMEPGGLSLFPSERIWRARVPPKVAFFAWEASWGKVLTQEQLQRRGFSLANRCFLCLSEEETVDHLLLHLKATLLGWNGGFVGKRHKKAWQMAPLCIFWTVWKERNRGSLAESHSSLEVATWDGVEERLRKRLSLWKRQYISKGEHEFEIGADPKGLSLGWWALERKPHLVEWSIVCSDKRKGGLDVRNLALLNKALLCKWSWRFAVEREALWRQVICAKYGEEEGGWRSRVVRGSFGVDLWKAIRRGWDVLGDNLVYSVGHGGLGVDVWSHSGEGVWLLGSLGGLMIGSVQCGASSLKVAREEGIGAGKTRRFSCQSYLEFFGASEEEEFIDHILLLCGWPEVYRAYFFPSLGFRGCSPLQLERRYWGGLGLVWERKGRKCGFQLPCAFFGLFGRKETVGRLKMKSIRFMGGSSEILGLDLRQVSLHGKLVGESHSEGDFARWYGFLLVTSPAGNTVHTLKGTSGDKFEFKAPRSGMYKFCFQNSYATPETVSFYIHVGHIPNEHNLAKDEHLDPINVKIAELREALESVTAEQKYLKARDTRHRHSFRGARPMVSPSVS
ncbi:Transmembrane emp24 domain-containing protein p24beta3 [Vitis vinifera]|uniref:Transmembrane emp24 domain-containing protein p24beta3 n=1 Tax=Vitis vinifera TaxID=29760 RepID=A0A438F778_VITVI|nr:Transmembrane emp24 domain-containing protein p24beta3 [Vitis vinifera]